MLEEEISQIADFIPLQNIPKQINPLQSQALGQTRSFFFPLGLCFWTGFLSMKQKVKKPCLVLYRAMKSSRERSKSAVFDEPMGVSATEQSYCRSARRTRGAACHISAIGCWLCTGILLHTWLVDLISAMLL